MLNQFWADRTLESFIIGESNRYAYNAAKEVVNHPGKYNPLYIYGDIGLGKTHLLNAVSICMTRSNSKLKSLCISTECFCNEYIEALQNNRIIEFRKKYRSSEALLLVDIQFMEGKPRLQEEFFHTINALLERDIQVVVTAGQPPNKLNKMCDRLTSRLMQGLVTEIKIPELSLRVEFMHRRNEELKYQIHTSLLDSVTEHIAPNFRTLEAALVRMGSWQEFTREEVTILNIKKVLAGYFIEEEITK